MTPTDTIPRCSETFTRRDWVAYRASCRSAVLSHGLILRTVIAEGTYPAQLPTQERRGCGDSSPFIPSHSRQWWRPGLRRKRSVLRSAMTFVHSRCHTYTRCEIDKEGWKQMDIARLLFGSFDSWPTGSTAQGPASTTGAPVKAASGTDAAGMNRLAGAQQRDTSRWTSSVLDGPPRGVSRDRYIDGWIPRRRANVKLDRSCHSTCGQFGAGQSRSDAIFGAVLPLAAVEPQSYVSAYVFLGLGSWRFCRSQSRPRQPSRCCGLTRATVQRRRGERAMKRACSCTYVAFVAELVSWGDSFAFLFPFRFAVFEHTRQVRSPNSHPLHPPSPRLAGVDEFLRRRRWGARITYSPTCPLAVCCWLLRGGRAGCMKRDSLRRPHI